MFGGYPPRQRQTPWKEHGTRRAVTSYQRIKGEYIVIDYTTISVNRQMLLKTLPFLAVGKNIQMQIQFILTILRLCKMRKFLCKIH